MANNIKSEDQIAYEVLDGGVASISLNRPKVKNAQGLDLTYALDAAFRRAALDSTVKVIILRAEGSDFSAGHDVSMTERSDVEDYPTVSLWGSFNEGGWEGFYSREKEIYSEMAERWRALPKPTIAAVQGNCIAGAMILAWVCDLIIASEDARFADITPNLGICGVEMFNHPYELPPRKAKEWLFTTDFISAEEAHRFGMINKVVPRENLDDYTLKLARRIAKKPAFGLRLAKELINSSQDMAGRKGLTQYAFTMHQLCHSHNMLKHDFLVETEGFPPALRAKIDEYIATRDSRTLVEFTQLQRLDIPKREKN